MYNTRSGASLGQAIALSLDYYVFACDKGVKGRFDSYLILSGSGLQSSSHLEHGNSLIVLYSKIQSSLHGDKQTYTKRHSNNNEYYSATACRSKILEFLKISWVTFIQLSVLSDINVIHDRDRTNIHLITVRGANHYAPLIHRSLAWFIPDPLSGK